jgi:hypothetical protein
MASSSEVARAKVEIHPLTAEEREQEEDALWVLHDPEIQAKYLGQFFVPYRRQIIAHGDDIEAVLAEAARVTGRKPEDLPICGIDAPLLDVPH